MFSRLSPKGDTYQPTARAVGSKVGALQEPLTFLTFVLLGILSELGLCGKEQGMGIRNRKRELLRRLEAKTLDSQFLIEIGQGLSCSPFEAKAVLEVVHEVYFPFLDDQAVKAPPGRVTLVAVAAEEPAGKAVADCEKVTVCLAVHRGEEDDRLLRQEGPTAFRRARIAELCQQAFSQGGLLTREDLAFHVFFVSPRTITRDLAELRRRDPEAVIPLRSRLHDIGPLLTHREQIVRLALEGKTTTQICRITRHSPPAVTNYLATFERCVYLAREGMQAGQIAFLLRKGKGLIRQYLDLLKQCEQDRNMAYHLDELLRLGRGGKSDPGRG